MELLMIPRMKAVLDKKWDKYASQLFVKRLTFFLVYLVMFAGGCHPSAPACLHAHHP
jgi:hypothetical protein